jgi:hypothetical protein
MYAKEKPLPDSGKKPESVSKILEKLENHARVWRSENYSRYERS